MIDLATWLANADPEDEERARREDEARVQRAQLAYHMRGSRPGSKPYAARLTTWYAFDALTVHRANMVPSTIAVLTRLLTEATTRGANPIGYARWQLAQDCHLSESTTRKALTRLERQGWFTLADRGTNNNVKGQTGRAASYLLLPQPSNPPLPSTLRGLTSANESSLSGTPVGRTKSDRENEGGLQRTSKLVLTTTGSKYLVSRPPLDHGEKNENRGVDGDVAVTKRMVSEPVRKTKTTATDWLQTYLSWGPMPRSEAIRRGGLAGFSRPAIDRAAHDLAVVSTKAPVGGGGRGKPPRPVRVWSLQEQS